MTDRDVSGEALTPEAAFALGVERGAREERERIVAWLRTIPQGACPPRAFADLIDDENGAHHE